MHHAFSLLAALVVFLVIIFAARSGDSYEETNIYEGDEPAPRRNKITLTVGDSEGSLRPAKARKLARELLEKADEAEDES